MYCSKCGAKLEDGAVKCSYCNNEIPETENAPEVKKPKNNKKKVIVLCAIIVAIMIAAVVVLLCSIRSPEKTADVFIEGLFDCDGKKMLKCMHPEMLKSWMKEDDCTRKDVEKMVEDEFGEWILELDENYYRWKYAGIAGIYEGYELSEHEKREIIDYCDEEFGVKVKQLKTLEVEIKIKTSEGVEYLPICFTMFKDGLKWYIWDV